MRTTVVAFAGSLLLVVSSVALSQCGGAAPAPGEIAFIPVASVDQIMDGIVTPSSQAIFDAVVYDNGALVQAPKTDDDWYALRMHALAVAEAGNLLLIPPRAKDAEDWAVMSKTMTETAAAVAAAAESQNVERLLETGGHLYTTCTGCHRKYLTPP
jgi:hypothetical protein